MLATRGGLIKKTALTEYDTNRTGGIIAINLREGDELVSAMLVEEDSDLLLVSRKGMSIRFTASDAALRPMGRSTSGVIGMHFREDDQLLDASVVSDSGYVFVVTEGGYAKRTAADQYRVQDRGGLGIKVAKLDRGSRRPRRRAHRGRRGRGSCGSCQRQGGTLVCGRGAGQGS